MKFVDNANLTTFLLGQPIQVNVLTDSNLLIREYQLNLPTIGQLYCDQKLQMSLGLLNTPLDDLQKQFPMVKNFTYYSFFIALRVFADKLLTIKRNLDYMIYSFDLLGLRLVIADSIYINGQKITEEEFDYLRNLILFLTKIKTKNSQILEQDSRYKASQDLIAKIKGQNKSNQDSDANFEKNYVVLLWEFGLTPEQIQQLNIYQYETILRYTNSAVETKINTVAAGNGLTKKFKYITQGGKKNGK